MEKQVKPVVATFIDYDNIYITLKNDFDTKEFDFSTLPNHFRRIACDKGAVVFAKAYANWADRGLPIMTSFGANLIKLEHVFPKANGKDRSDASIIIDAMQLLYTNKKVTHFLLFSGDSDFRELALHITGLGKTIMVCSFSHVLGADLRRAADFNFIPLEIELGVTQPAPKPVNNSAVNYGPLIRSISRLDWKFIGWTEYRDTYISANYPSIDWSTYGVKSEEGNKDDFLERALQDGVILRRSEPYKGSKVTTISLNKQHPLVKELISSKN